MPGSVKYEQPVTNRSSEPRGAVDDAPQENRAKVAPVEHADPTTEPHLAVWTSHWFLRVPVVENDAGEKEGPGVIHARMVSGWDVDLGREWAEPPVFKPDRFLTEWLMNSLLPLPHILLAIYWTCTKAGAPWRTFDGYVVTSEHQAETQTLERGRRSGRVYAGFVPFIVCIRWVPALLCAFFFEDLRDANLVPLALAYLATQLILLNQVAGKVAFQARAANSRLQSAFERRKNEFLTGWLICALDVAIFEVRLAAARVGLDLDERLTFECSVVEMRHFLAPVLHTLDRPDRSGRRPKERLVLEALGQTVEGFSGQLPSADVLARLDSSGQVRAEKSDGMLGSDTGCMCSAPARLVLLRLLWHSLQRDGSYRQQFGSGVRSNSVGGPLGAICQVSMLLTLILAPHVVRWLSGNTEALNARQRAFCICTGLGLVAGASLMFQFTTSSVIDMARRRHLVAACRVLITGSVRETQSELLRCVREQAACGPGDLPGAAFPRISTQPETMLAWSKILRTSRFLGQHFFRRSEVLLLYSVVLFGFVFAYLLLANASLYSIMKL